MSIYEVWKPGTEVPSIAELRRVACERVTVKPFEPEKDGYVFLHGLAIVKFKNKMYCSWAHNKVVENSDDEEVNYATSDDDGKTWSPWIKGNCNPEKGVAASHGAFLVHENRLYFFAPQFKGQLGAEMLKMSAYVLDEETDAFRYLGVALDDRFWPMCEPILLENGSYLMAGIYVGADYRAPDNVAAVAISRGSDVLRWDIVKVPKADGVKVWGECTVTIDGGVCRMYCREHSRKLCALYSESTDYGKTWSVMDHSNLPMIDSKPYAGTLSDGRHYLIATTAKDVKRRTPLTIALTKPGETQFSSVYAIDEGKHLSYPYAIEIDRKLYVAYSSTNEGYNRNSAELAIIDVEELK